MDGSRAAAARLGLRRRLAARMGRSVDALDLGGPVAAIALGALLASFAMNFWYPFLPLYEQRLGAGSEAAALAWVAAATTGQGIARILAGPLWGVLADRYGRKLMFVRALFAATLTTLVVALATQPWHVVLALTLQGLLSGFIPAAVALTTVTVPGDGMSGALATVTGAQYVGTMLGPALGAGLAALFDLRQAILIGATLPALSGVVVIWRVPRDPITRARLRPAPRGPVPRRHGLGLPFSTTLLIGLTLYFVIYTASQLVRVATPVALQNIARGSAENATGIAFTIAGIGSVVGAWGLARLAGRPSMLRRLLISIALTTAAAHLFLAVSASLWLYTLWFTVAAVVEGTIIPATNTLIASSVPLDLRGTAFGLAASIQATGFIVGPLAAALFARFSLRAGFVAVALAFLASAALVAICLKPIRPDNATQNAPPEPR